MIDLLEKLYCQLKEVFEKELSSKERKLLPNGTIDVLSTFMALKKHEKDFKILIEKASSSRETLIYEFDKETISDALDRKFIKEASGLNTNKYFIVSNGLFHYYSTQGMNLNNVFSSFDEFKFPDKILRLKAQEKIWSIFIILFGADSKDSLLNASALNLETLDKYFNFLKTIEKEIKANGLSIGKQIGWGYGKDINFRKFLTNTVDLPKTGIYHYPSSKYWLDLDNRKNVKYLLDLILDEYTGKERFIANELLYNAIWSLSNKMLSDLGELPKPLNKILVEELRG